MTETFKHSRCVCVCVMHPILYLGFIETEATNMDCPLTRQTVNSINHQKNPKCISLSLHDYCKTIETDSPRDSSCNLEGIVTGAVPMETDREALREAALRRAAWKFVVDAWPSLRRYHLLFLSTFAWGTASARERERVPFISYGSTRGWWVILIGVLFVLPAYCLGGVGPGRNERAPWYDTSVFRGKIIRKRQRTWSCVLQTVPCTEIWRIWSFASLSPSSISISLVYFILS